jgi:hypothetical protein
MLVCVDINTEASHLASKASPSYLVISRHLCDHQVYFTATIIIEHNLSYSVVSTKRLNTIAHGVIVYIAQYV